MSQTDLILPDADSLCDALAELIRPHFTPQMVLVGLHSGGVWVAERLHAALGATQPLGSMDVSFYRDDYAARGLHNNPRSSDMPFDVNGAHIILVDDVLYTGRTTRAALNELFDYGRPASVTLAVLVDRGERELPVAARWCAHRLAAPLDAGKSLRLSRQDDGQLSLKVVNA